MRIIKKILVLVVTLIVIFQESSILVMAEEDVYGNNISEYKIFEQTETHIDIVKQPKDEIVAEGENAIFTVEASGNGLKYLWMRSKDNGETWEKAFYTGYTTSEMTVPVKSFVYGYQFYCQITDKDGNQVQTNVVCAKKITNGLVLANDNNHSYAETQEGKLLINKDKVLTDASVINYSLEYAPTDIIWVSTNDVLILRFTARGEQRCGHISVSINDKEYFGTFSLNTELTEYYLPISGLSQINSIILSVDSDEQMIDLGNVELLNYGDIKVSNLKTGLFNIEAEQETLFNENQAIGSTATALIADDKYLYAIGSGILTIYDIDNMEICGTVSGLGNTRDLDFTSDGNYLVINSRENGTYFVSVINKKSPSIVSHYTTLEMATGLCVYGNYVFLCSRYYGIEIVDISDIYNPIYVTQISKVNEEYYDCCVSDGYLYVSVWAQMKIEIYSLTDVCNPEYVNTIMIDGEAGGISVIDGILYVATGYHSRNTYTTTESPGYGMGNGMEIYDVSNPQNPIWLSSSKIDGRYRYSGFDHWRVKVDGKYAYFTNIYNGIYIYDVSDLTAPKRVNHITVYIDKNSPSYKKITQGTFLFPYDTLDHAQGEIAGIAIADGKLFFSDTNTGLYEYRDDKFSTELIEQGALEGSTHIIEKPTVNGYDITLYQSTASVYAVEEYGGYLYVACGDSGIQILDEDLTLVKTMRTEDAVRDLLILDGYLYTAESSKGLGIYYINGSELQFVYRYLPNYSNLCFSQLELNYDADTLLIQAGWVRAIFLDITKRSEPTVISELSTKSMYYGNMASGISSSSTLSYYDNSGVYCYDRSDSGEYSMIYNHKGAFISERNGLANYSEGVLAIYNDGYVIFDPRSINDTPLTSLNIIKIKGKFLRGKPIISGNTLVVSYGYGNQVSIVDISDICNPIMQTQFSVYGNPDVATITENGILIPLRHGGLLRVVKR